MSASSTSPSGEVSPTAHGTKLYRTPLHDSLTLCPSRCVGEISAFYWPDQVKPDHFCQHLQLLPVASMFQTEESARSCLWLPSWNLPFSHARALIFIWARMWCCHSTEFPLDPYSDDPKQRLSHCWRWRTETSSSTTLLQKPECRIYHMQVFPS